jgi:thiopeptide-type bacteriocin biosynthesis protein
MSPSPGVSAEHIAEAYEQISNRIVREGPAGLPTTSQWVEYQPEVDRYGGEGATQSAESVFVASSTAALRFMSDDLTNIRSIRLGRAMMAMVATLFAFFDERAAVRSFSRRFSNGQLVRPNRDQRKRDAFRAAFDNRFLSDGPAISEQLSRLWDALEHHEPISDVLDPYCEALRRYREEVADLAARDLVAFGSTTPGDWRDAAGPLASSIVHMMNNRLGVTREEESFLGHLVHRALGAN